MSGGVDSSVAAALLLRDGYQVVGAYMKQWSDSKDLHGICSWKDDRREALRVAAHLGIPLLTLDFEKEYKQWVVKYMFAEYKLGRTPNPDVMCNKFVKFGVWLEKALEMGFDYMATGHYARLASSNQLSDFRSKNFNHTEVRSPKADCQSTFQLMEAKDKEKDQTYFLHQVSQKQLQHVLFPVGEYTKKQVRALAKKFGLPTAEREESMGICFIGEVPMKEFLQQKIQPKKGKIVTSLGNAVGEHEGLPFYTIGQRHGFSQAGGGKPLFVVAKDQKKNVLVVGNEDDSLLYRKQIEVGELNWCGGQEPDFPLECTVRLRHRQPLQKVMVVKVGSNIVVQCKNSQKAVTPGQFAVFYKNGECLGGGVIA